MSSHPTTVKRLAPVLARQLATQLLLWVFFLAPSFAETLVVYGSDAFPPVSYLSNGQVRGIFPAILKRLERETGDTYDLQLVPWARANKLAMDGKGAVANISLNSERAAVFDYSRPLFTVEILLVVRKGHEFPFRQLSDLNGKLIGAGLGSSYKDEVDQAIADGVIKVERDPNQQSRLRKLLAGRVDAIFVGSGRIGLQAMLDADPDLKNQADQFTILPKVVAVDPLHVAIPKSMGKRALVDRLDAAYLRLKSRGELDDLIPR
jgi:polar amino acid transport system substrate-binding protein